jgi:hypothetical protein
MRVAKIDAIRITVVEVRRVFGFAEHHVLGIDIHILRKGPHRQADHN